MTDEEYRGRSRTLTEELERVRDLMDEHGGREDIGITSELHDRVRADLDDVIRRFGELDAERWGAASGP